MNIFKIKNKQYLDDILEKYSYNLIVIMFSNKTCKMSRDIRNTFIEYANAYKNCLFLYIDIGNIDIDIKKEYEIKYTPTFIFKYNKKNLVKMIGNDKNKLYETIKKCNDLIITTKNKIKKKIKMIEELNKLKEETDTLQHAHEKNKNIKNFTINNDYNDILNEIKRIKKEQLLKTNNIKSKNNKNKKNNKKENNDRISENSKNNKNIENSDVKIDSTETPQLTQDKKDEEHFKQTYMSEQENKDSDYTTEYSQEKIKEIEERKKNEYIRKRTQENQNKEKNEKKKIIKNLEELSRVYRVKNNHKRNQLSKLLKYMN